METLSFQAILKSYSHYDGDAMLGNVEDYVKPQGVGATEQGVVPLLNDILKVGEAASVIMRSDGGQFHAAPLTEAMPKLGLLDALMQDASVSDILVNGLHSIYVDRAGKLVDAGVRFERHEDLWAVAEAVVASVGQKLSKDRPMVDTRLPDGSRVNIVAPPMAVDGVTISIRKFPNQQITLESMVEKGELSNEIAEFLREAIRSRLNIIVCGGTGSGKTTMLNALSASIGEEERIVTIEDSAELRLQQRHVVRLESKPALTEGEMFLEVSIRDLVRNALRMRPDRIIIGESRGPEALDMLQAMNTGHEGSMTTLHANSPRDSVSRLETLISLAMPQMTTRLVRQQIASTINIIINMARFKDGTRRIKYINEVVGMENDLIVMQELLVYNTTAAEGAPGYQWKGAPRHQVLADTARKLGLLRGMR